MPCLVPARTRLLASPIGKQRELADPIVEHDPDHAERRAAQRIWILASGRLLVDRPEAHQRIELVGERDRDRHRIGRHEIVRALRLVVILARVCDGLVLALRLGVVFSHQALQLGEFADHVGEQIGLAELGGALDLRDVGADERRELDRQPLDARDALGLRAELLVKHDVLELRQPILEPRLQIGLVEELRVRQPRPDDALVAGDDRLAAVRRLDVGDQDELVDELPRSADRAARSISGCCGWWCGSPRAGSRGTRGRTTPISTTGHSTRPATSSSSAWSSTSSKPCAKARFLASARICALRRSGSSTTLALASFATIVVEAPHLDRVRAPGSGGRAWCVPAAMPSTWNGTTSGSSVSGPKVATIECSGRTQVSRPTPQRIDFGHGKVRITTGSISDSTLDRGTAGLLDQREIEVALLRVLLDGGLVDRRRARRS